MTSRWRCQGGSASAAGAGQGELDLGVGRTGPARKGPGGGPLPITASRMGHLLDAQAHTYLVLRFEVPAGGDEVFAQLVLDAAGDRRS